MKELFVFICFSYSLTCFSQKEETQNSTVISAISRISFNIIDADESMILKDTPILLQKNRYLNVIKPDQSMILLETPEYLKKYNYLSVVSANESMMIIESPVILKKEIKKD